MASVKRRQDGGQSYDKKDDEICLAWHCIIIYVSSGNDSGCIQLYGYGNHRNPWKFFLQNYKTLFTTGELLGMIGGTFALAIGSACIATILGTIGAIGAFTVKRTRGAIDFVNQVPVVNAEVVTGFSICVLLIVVLGLSKDSFFPLIVGHVVLEAPLCICLFCQN